jgi:membrane protein DedA with SNARE-associated domain
MSSLTDLLARYGYAVIALFLFIESIGVPIPGESALVTAAALAGRGRMSIAWVFLAAVVGTVSGGMSGYWIGVRGGHAIVGHFGRALRIDDQRLDRARIFFERHGASALLVGRFVAVVRSYLGIFAGVAAMAPRRFAAYNAIGSVVWSLVFTAVGYEFGVNLPRLTRDLGRVSLILSLLIALVILLVVAWRWFSANGAGLVSLLETRWKRLDSRAWVVQLRADHPTLWRLVIFQFAGGEYLAVHLMVGWLLSLGALGVFAAITGDVVVGAPLTHTDVLLAHRLGVLAGPTLLGILDVVGGVGGRVSIALITAMVALVLGARRSWLTLGGWLAAYAGAIALDLTLRRIVIRGELPLSSDLFDQHLTATLPTGKTVGGVVIFGLIAHLLVIRARSAPLRVLVVSLTLLLVGAIVAARLFLGTSYLSIESASVASGVIWLAACISGLELAKHRRSTIPVLGD